MTAAAVTVKYESTQSCVARPSCVMRAVFPCDHVNVSYNPEVHESMSP